MVVAPDTVPPDLGRAAAARSYAVLTELGTAAVVVDVEETESVRVGICPKVAASLEAVPFAKPVIFWEFSVSRPADEKLAKTVPAEFFHSCRLPVCEATPETVNGTVVVAVVLMLAFVRDGEAADT
jgi:hypothetical protein